MVLTEIRCSRCGHRFEAETVDRDDPSERDEPTSPIRCPNCNSSMLTIVRTIRRLVRRPR